jgi:hypothetical protein
MDAPLWARRATSYCGFFMKALSWQLARSLVPSSCRSSSMLCMTKILRTTILLVRFEDFAAVTMKNAVFRNVTPCGSCKNLSFGGEYRLHHQGGKNQLASYSKRSPACWLFTLMMAVIRSSKTSVLKRATRRHILEDGILLVISIFDNLMFGCILCSSLRHIMRIDRLYGIRYISKQQQLRINIIYVGFSC